MHSYFTYLGILIEQSITLALQGSEKEVHAPTPPDACPDIPIRKPYEEEYAQAPSKKPRLSKTI